jgi:carbon-monoxide dehydrogenase small subunit
MRIHFEVNQRNYELDVPPMKRLLDVLREDLGLTGTKEGCGEGECGSCSVLLNGDAANSCLVPACQVEKATIITVEGLARDGVLSTLQQAFLQHGGAQCGICTPGMLIAATAFLNNNPHPDHEEIKAGIAGNLCRCTGYMKIVEAIAAATEGRNA